MSEWISVEGRLPRAGKKVLGCVLHSRENASAFSYRTIDFVERRLDQWRNVNESGFPLGEPGGRGIVTHWMPLPELPKEDK